MQRPFAMITGMGHAHGSRLVPNEMLEELMDTTDEWIVTRTGIKQRWWSEEGEYASVLAERAARNAIEEAGVTPEQIDGIIIGTVTGDMKFPSTANFLQARLGADNAFSFDLSAACSGWVYGLSLAESLIATGKGKRILVVGVEILTSMTDMSDRSTAVLFGDAAGAALLEVSDGQAGLLSTYMGSNGKLAELLWAPSGGSRFGITPVVRAAGKEHLLMKGRHVYTHAVRAMADATQQALDLAGLQPEEIDFLVPHQANIRIIQATVERFGFPQDRVIINIDRFGNTSTASIPIALDEARRQGRIKPGHKVVMTVFGGGFTWASGVIQF
ncbi:MAG: ketoacyl-ACP synthase III [Candidatus Delongbacteria bacterium]|nr:ketoacyl-ACP synthase III [Candidatus Delongbacteria bacterium]